MAYYTPRQKTDRVDILTALTLRHFHDFFQYGIGSGQIIGKGQAQPGIRSRPAGDWSFIISRVLTKLSFRLRQGK